MTDEHTDKDLVTSGTDLGSTVVRLVVKFLLQCVFCYITAAWLTYLGLGVPYLGLDLWTT